MRYLDAHSGRLLAVDERKRKRAGKKAGSFFASIGRTLTGEPSVEEQEVEKEEKEIAHFVSSLLTIRWVPTVNMETAGMGEGFPWSSEHRQDGVSLPTQTRPLQDVWISSSTFGLVETPVLSIAMREMLGWCRPLLPSVIARQIVGLSEYHTRIEKTKGESLRLLSIRLPSLYNELDRSMLVLMKDDSKTSSANGAKDAHSANVNSLRSEIEAVRIVLEGKKWVWVENTFVESGRVSSKEQRIDCRPYLYSVPRHLRTLSSTFRQTLVETLDVRPQFGPSDYAQVTRDMHQENSKKHSSDENDDGDVLSLSGRLLDLAINLAQILSDYKRDAIQRLEIYLPDETGALIPSTSLHFNDVPWMDRGLSTEVFVHPKISNVVASRLGVASLRMSLIDSNIVDLSITTTNSNGLDKKTLGEDEGQSFGQGEPLTRRLKGIIELYPEGTQVLAELLQNADDAGATEFSLLLNKKSYGQKSLLSSNMSAMQGPSLYCYNDAVFQPHDFENLARIGQGSKLDKLQTTGRFGLGFNSVYHYTSVPSFVSGDHIVWFDPHTSHVPRATTQKPGLKLKFTTKKSDSASETTTPLRERFRDQFQPYELFGNDMKKYFHGTLFRLPLRTLKNSKNDEIKNTTCNVDTITKLLEDFQRVAVQSLLFLRNVKRIRVYVVDEEEKKEKEKEKEEEEVQDASEFVLNLAEYTEP